VGFHNGGSFIKLDNVEEMDSLLNGWLFNGMSFSKFWHNTPYNNPYPTNNIKFFTETSENDLNVYNLRQFYGKNALFKSIWQNPDRVMVISREKIDNLDAMVYSYRNISKNKDSEDSVGWLLVFEFPREISNEIYVNIEYSTPFAVQHSHCDMVKYDKITINVTSGCRLFSFRCNAWDIPIKGLNIHHKYYIKGHKPWEYDNDALVTLCKDCHKKRHESSSVRYYDQENKFIGTLKVCDRCGGSGYLSQYIHVENGICFKCGGEGVIIKD